VVKKECGGKDSYAVIENGQQTGTYDKASAIPMPDDLLTMSGDRNESSKDEKNYLKESGGKTSVVVGGKNYGSYAEVQEVFVTPDKKTVFHDWMDMNGRSGISFNGKKTDLTPIDEMEAFIDYKLIKSHDKNTLAYLCLGTPTGSGKQTLPAILVKADGTKKAIKVNNIESFGTRVFSISSSNELCWLDTETWDLYTEGRKVGSFKKNNNVRPSDLAIIAGTDLNKAVLYDRMGNLYFLDGHVEAAGAVHPFLSTSNGKQYIIWLKQDGENILKGSIELK
jgi:prepilin-type processing-associated H-X9-DG protein